MELLINLKKPDFIYILSASQIYFKLEKLLLAANKIVVRNLAETFTRKTVEKFG